MTYQAPIPTAASDTDAPDITLDADDQVTAPQWTGPKMAAFLRHLAASHSVSAAARSVGLSRQSAYKLRARLKDQPFDLAWKCALRRNYDALADAALDRALNGVEVLHFHKGELIHTSRRFDEGLTVALLKMRIDLAPTPVGPSAYNRESLPADDFGRLLARVETGSETWR